MDVKLLWTVDSDDLWGGVGVSHNFPHLLKHGYIVSFSYSVITQSCPTLWDPMDCRPPGSSVHGFPRQEYWSGLPFPSPGDLPNPGIEPRSPSLQADTLTSEPPGKPPFLIQSNYYFCNPNSKEIKLVNPKGNQPWIFIGRTDAEAPILWPPNAKSRLIGKDPDVGKDWGQ